jgi:hypothetical protein
MSAMQSLPRFDEILRKWLNLAEIRLANLFVLFRNGRRQRYYAKEPFAIILPDAICAVKLWKRLAGRAPVVDKEDLHPATRLAGNQVRRRPCRCHHWLPEVHSPARRLRMIPKSGNRFSDKIMRWQ